MILKMPCVLVTSLRFSVEEFRQRRSRQSRRASGVGERDENQVYSGHHGGHRRLVVRLRRHSASRCEVDSGVDALADTGRHAARLDARRATRVRSREL